MTKRVRVSGPSTPRSDRTRKKLEISLSDTARQRLEERAKRRYGGNKSATIEAWLMGTLLVAALVVTGCSGADGGAIAAPSTSSAKSEATPPSTADAGPSMASEDAGAEPASGDEGPSAQAIVMPDGSAAPLEASTEAAPPACIPSVCGAQSCGVVSSGCGGTIDCGCAGACAMTGANGCAGFWTQCPSAPRPKVGVATAGWPEVDGGTVCVEDSTALMYLCPTAKFQQYGAACTSITPTVDRPGCIVAATASWSMPETVPVNVCGS